MIPECRIDSRTSGVSHVTRIMVWFTSHGFQVGHTKQQHTGPQHQHFYSTLTQSANNHLIAYSETFPINHLL